MVKEKRIYKAMMIGLCLGLFLGIGGSYAYFSVILNDNREENNTIVNVEHLPDAVVISNIEKSAGSFTATDIYPGHREVASLSVGASGKRGTSANFQIVYDVEENELGNHIKTYVYQSDTPIETTANYFACEKKFTQSEENTRYYETCQEKNLGTLIQETTLIGGKEKVVIGKDNVVVTTSDGETNKYYYVVVEFVNESSSQNEDMNKTLQGKINVELIAEKVTYNEDILHGADPVIKENLIPITIENDGIVKKADTKTKWYSYEEKNWANAVILKDESITYENNEVIPEENIESYFVWIPRYRYLIFNDEVYSGLTSVDNSKPQRIEIEFETKDVQASNGTKKGEWLTHPAFTSMESNGMWVGKFETGKSNVAPDNSFNAVGVQIKPNVVSWRNIQVGNAFYTSYYYLRELDSHMMKNQEWGSVAYLSHSKYGSEASVRFNNHSGYLTGYASVNEPTCGYTTDNRVCNQYGTAESITKPYNTSVGYLASTTGNITGIYDMSGGAWEYVMGILTNETKVPFSGRNATYHSGFTGPYGEGGALASGYAWPESRYYDTYAYGTSYREYTRGILGDATGEMGPFASVKYGSRTNYIHSWYKNHAYNVYNSSPWYMRSGGCRHGSQSGMFAFSQDYGSSYDDVSFRIVLTPNV